MNGLDVAFLIVVLVPLFAAQWRVSLLGLAAQGLLLWVASGGREPTFDAFYALNVVDFLVVRGAIAPALMFSAFRRHGVTARNDVIPANLIAWMVVVLLVLATFRFAEGIEPGPGGYGRVAVAAASLVLGFFVLATQESVFSQVVGALRIENAVALFELAGPEEHAEPEVRALHVMVTGGAVALYVWYLRALAVPAPAGRP